MILTDYDVQSLRNLQMTQRPVNQVFAGIKAQYHFVFNTAEHEGCVCGLDGFLLDVRKHPTDEKRFFIDLGVKTNVDGFYSTYENIEVIRVYTNQKSLETMFGYMFAQADKAEYIVYACNTDEPYLFLEEPNIKTDNVIDIKTKETI